MNKKKSFSGYAGENGLNRQRVNLDTKNQVVKELDLTAILDAKAVYTDADFIVIAAPTNYDNKKNFFDTRRSPERKYRCSYHGIYRSRGSKAFCKYISGASRVIF